MPPKYQITQEGVICIIENGDLVAIVRKNGEVIFYDTKRMGFDDIKHLLADLVGQAPVSMG